MLKKLAFLFLLFFPLFSIAEGVEVEKKDYAMLIVSSYVNGFNEFDTSVVGFEDSISVGIYYDIKSQKEERAEQLAARFQKQIPALLNRYEWAEGIQVNVSVHSEDRIGRGY